MAQKRRTQAERRAVARGQIARAALRVCSFRGYREASMDDIALAAGLSKGGLYHHFPTKRDVLAAVVDEIAGEGGLWPGREGRALPDSESVARARLLIDIWAEASRDEKLRERLAVLRVRAQPGDAIEALVAAGSLVRSLLSAAATATEASSRDAGTGRAA